MNVTTYGLNNCSTSGMTADEEPAQEIKSIKPKASTMYKNYKKTWKMSITEDKILQSYTFSPINIELCIQM